MLSAGTDHTNETKNKQQFHINKNQSTLTKATKNNNTHEETTAARNTTTNS